MSCPTTSLVAVRVADAQRASAAMLVSIEAARSAERAKTIATLLATERRRTGWFQRRRAITQQEAEQMVDGVWVSDWGGRNPHGWWRINSWGNEQLAERLQSAAALSADGHVYLNLEDAQVVHSYL